MQSAVVMNGGLYTKAVGLVGKTTISDGNDVFLKTMANNVGEVKKSKCRWTYERS